MIYWFIENQSEAVVWVILLTVTSAHPANNMGLYSLSGRKSYREISKPRDSGFIFSNRFDNWQAPRQQRCRDACQILER